MATECERKFIVDHLPDAATLGEGRRLRQGYLAEDNGVELRVRITSPAGGPTGGLGAGAEEATLTVKAGGGLSRTEVEASIPAVEAEQLWPHTLGRRIEKIRHRVPLGANTAEVDVFEGALSGLVVVEVEFESEGAAGEFAPPAWFGRELTGRPEWSNSSLARRGLPEA